VKSFFAFGVAKARMNLVSLQPASTGSEQVRRKSEKVFHSGIWPKEKKLVPLSPASVGSLTKALLPDYE
jgi:hypothetical protein